MSWTDDFGDLNDHPLLMETNFTFPGQINMYRGKVRDMYLLEDGLVVMITTDRMSAFDRIMPRGIPYKGRILSELSVASQDNFMLLHPFNEQYKTRYRTSEQRLIGSQTIIADYIDPIPIEMVVREFLSGHAAREYNSGKREICGVKLPEGLKENDILPEKIITPTLKGKLGQHDEDITPEEIIKRGIVSKHEYRYMEQYAQDLFDNEANTIDLLPVDAKYEFGRNSDNHIVLIDEIHTPDSARFFDSDDYTHAQDHGLPQRHLSKEFFRQWLIQQGFQGKEGQELPIITDEIVIETSKRYIEVYERIMNKKFVFENIQYAQPIEERIYNNVTEYLKKRRAKKWRQEKRWEDFTNEEILQLRENYLDV